MAKTTDQLREEGRAYQTAVIEGKIQGTELDTLRRRSRNARKKLRQVEKKRKR